MSGERPVFVSQIALISALLAELDRQYPGAWVNQTAMNAIIEAATHVMKAANAGGVTATQEPAL